MSKAIALARIEEVKKQLEHISGQVSEENAHYVNEQLHFMDGAIDEIFERLDEEELQEGVEGQ